LFVSILEDTSKEIVNIISLFLSLGFNTCAKGAGKPVDQGRSNTCSEWKYIEDFLLDQGISFFRSFPTLSSPLFALHPPFFFFGRMGV
jgi:hypothetical protein